MTGSAAHEAAAYLYRYLDLDAETAKIDWEMADGGEANDLIRRLAETLVAGTFGFGPDKLVSTGKKHEAYRKKNAVLTRQADAARERLPCWATNQDYLQIVGPIYIAIGEIKERLAKIEGPVKAAAQSDTLPGLEKLISDISQVNTDAWIEAGGGIDFDEQMDAEYRKVAHHARSLRKDLPVSLQGAAAKIRYHMFYRIGASMTEIADVESSEEYQLLLRAAEALEGAAGETLKAA